jgi:hypothetical protein
MDHVTPPAPAVRRYVGVDLGQLNDYTAVCVLEQAGTHPDALYAVRHLERWRGVAYPDQVSRLQRLLGTPELHGADLIVDRTGVGIAVVDSMRAAGLRPIAVSIHGGETVSGGGTEYRCPKRDLVGVVAVLLQAGRLKIAQQLPDAATLAEELRNFKVQFNPQTAHDSYAAWREQDHDDLVLAVALAAWFAETVGSYPIQIFLGGSRV